MISYEDLVYALNDWRARQGLPTSSAAAGTPPAERPAAVAPAMAPPAARPAAVAAPAMAAPAWAPDAMETMAQPPLEVGLDEGISIEGEEYGDAGEAMAFGSARPGTSPGFAPVVGGAPAPGQRR